MDLTASTRAAVALCALLGSGDLMHQGRGLVASDARPRARLASRSGLVPSADGSVIYDAALRVYWLADANLAATRTFGVRGINPDGSMTWNTAQTWVAALNDSSYLGHKDWRLPPTAQPDSGCTQHTSLGWFAYNCSHSDMGELFYRELGGRKGSSIATLRGDRVRLFKNIQPYLYWSGTVYPAVGKSSWSFSFDNGFEGTNLDVNAMYAIPEYPETPDAPSPPPPNIGMGVVPSVNARPSLVPGGDGKTVYDRSLNVTWLADGNLAARNTFGVRGINVSGAMAWHAAQRWIAAMNRARYLGRRDWRLPRTTQPDSGCNIQTPRLHQSAGYGCAASELGELFYTELGGEAGSTLAGRHDDAVSSFHDLQQSLYWSDADTQQGTFGAWTFSFGNGFQGSNFLANALYVIPVFDGPPSTCGAACTPKPPTPRCTGTKCK